MKLTKIATPRIGLFSKFPMEERLAFVLPLRNSGGGGSRVQLEERFECQPPCHGSAFAAWHDFTVFTPDPLSEDDEMPSGVCELRTELLEVLDCRGMNPMSDCPMYIRKRGEWPVAAQYVAHEVGCQLQYFKPFHRTGQEDDLNITERDIFGDVTKGATQSMCIAQNFVANFNFADMSITGDAWLSLRDGWLTGAPPARGAPSRYDFKITARNRMGEDSVMLGIVVSP